MHSLFEPLESEARAGTQLAPVVLAVALDQTYDYIVPEGLEVEPGCFVLVPFGPQSRIGVVWDKPVGETGKPVDRKKLKTITARLDVPPLPEITLRFAEWIARYTLAPLGMTVRMMMSARAAFEPTKPRFGVTLVEGAPEPPRMTPARKRALEIAGDGAIRAKAALALAAECSSGVVDGLVASGNLVEVAIPDKRPPLPDPHYRVTEFETEQAAAVHALRSAVDGANFSTTLLDGVTGSGKTEVYFEAVARTLERGHQALIMLPEIALTDQFMRRFEARFACQPVEWHSALSGPERGRVWKQTATGEARVVVGARSALFLPFCRSRPYHRRRGARRRLQAGRPGALPGARHGRAARQSRRLPGDPRFGDTVDRNARQCAHRALSPRHPPGALLGGIAPRCDRH